MKEINHSIEELQSRVEELETLNRQLLNEKEQAVKLEYAWTGNLGNWYWDIKTNRVTFNPLKVITLGYGAEEIPENVTYQYFTEMLHPDDYQKTMDAMMDHLYNSASVYEVEYRIRTKDGNYKWYYDRGKITKYNDEGKPLFVAGIVFDITEKKELQLEMEYKNVLLLEQTMVDDLTKINNHRAIVAHLKAEIIKAGRLKSPLSLVMFDIDDFKKINDTMGHIIGDQVLMEVANIIQKNIRDNDMIGRYGGEEFLLVLSNTDLNTASVVAKRIRKSIEEKFFSSPTKVTISGGVKQYSGEKVTEFIHGADINLYEAKKQGKNKIVY